MALAGFASLTMTAADDQMEDSNHPAMYVRGTNIGSNWDCYDNHRFTRDGDTYTITLPSIDGNFKISSSKWTYNYGGQTSGVVISASTIINGKADGPNLSANNLTDVTISFDLSLENGFDTLTPITFTVNGVTPQPGGISGTLPVLYVNVKNEDGSYNNEIIDKDLSHKNYFTGEYWLDLNGCEWMEAEGAESIGSADAPLPLEIKARGNYTRTGFSKKPFKLKLGKKQNMLGLTPEKSKHYAILAHADDNKGYLRNFTGFNLGKRIGLPWTPGQQPIEVVINGDYRGLYFLTESIRVGDGRVPIIELDDNVSDPELASGGYLVELDNYDEDNQIRMEEKGQAPCNKDMLRITFDTPESYSDLQYRFVKDQFTAMNDLIDENSDNLWSYIDLDDAARYYIVEEIISHTEAYHGSTYMFRDRGDDRKWHFSPLWDCGNGFNGSTSDFFYNNSPFGNTWIPSLRLNDKFNKKVKETWNWFMTNGYIGLTDDIDAYVSHIAAAAKADRMRWKDQPLPNSSAATSVADNSDMEHRKSTVLNHLNDKINWLKSQFGDYTVGGPFSEPTRDNTPAATLPPYVTGVENVAADSDNSVTVYYNLQGMKVDTPAAGNIYIKVRGRNATKELYR